MAFSSILYLWNKWNIRGFVMLSLLLQVILILFAPLRKKTTNNRIVFLLWLAYLMADWVAAFGIGLISHNQGSSSAHIADVDKALRVFWASFLLLHLGGPDAIIAFSLEDSSLWRRHLLSLTFQVGAIIYVFAQIFPSDKSPVFPTMLVFLAGVIKNVERTLALNRSSLPRLREWVLSQQESLDDEVDKSRDKPRYNVVKKNTLVEINLPDGYSHDDEQSKLAESIVVKHAYYFFQISKLFLTNLIFTRRQRKKSQEYFRKVSAMDALRVLSVELHFIYEVLHTKALAIRSKWSYVFRFIAFIDVAMAFIVFNRLKKHKLPELDVKITYLLLFGGIALDVIVVLMLVFSDWTVAEIQRYNRSSKLDSFRHSPVSAADYVRKPRIPTCEAKLNTKELNTKVTYKVLDTPLIFRRWSESISACNLLSESLKKRPRKMYKHDWRRGKIAFSEICDFQFDMAEKTISYFHQAVDTITRGFGLSANGKRLMIANTRYVSTNPFIKRLWIFIFKEVIYKLSHEYDKTTMDDTESVHEAREENVSVTKQLYEARGDWFLRTLPREAFHRSRGDSDTESVHEARVDENPRTIPGDNEWAIMRDSICGVNYDESVILWHLATEMWYNREDPTAGNDEREFSKILSDYMMYLLLNQSNVVSGVAGIAQMRSASVAGSVLRWPLNKNIDITNVESLCEAIFAPRVETYVRTRGFPSFYRGIILARAIEKLGEGKWRVMSGVWVEMLTYAAGHIKGEAHAQVLSRGGELLAFVWLLLIHLGIVYRDEWAPHYIFRKEENSARLIDPSIPSEMIF